MIIRLRFWDFEEKEYTYHDDLDMALAWYAFETGKGEFELSTGLHDKNGKEIYEGDVVKSFDDEEINYTVEYDDELAAFTFSSYVVRGCLMEYGFDEDAGGETLEIETADDFAPTTEWAVVIGNIHENPELINAQG